MPYKRPFSFIRLILPYSPYQHITKEISTYFETAKIAGNHSKYKASRRVRNYLPHRYARWRNSSALYSLIEKMAFV